MQGGGCETDHAISVEKLKVSKHESNRNKVLHWTGNFIVEIS